MNTGRVLTGITGILFLPVFLYLFSCNSPDLTRLNVVVELNLGEPKEIKLLNDDIVKLALIDIDIVRDSVRHGIRAAKIKISVDGKEIILSSGNTKISREMSGLM